MALINLIIFALVGTSPFWLQGDLDGKGKNDKSAAQKPLTTIAFGSCNKQELPQPLWADILATKPQVWIWLGGHVNDLPIDQRQLEAKYAKQITEPGYIDLRQATSVIGTWNYTTDGSSSTNEDTKRLFLDFVGEPTESLRRQQDALYTSYVYGPKNQQVKIILLDTRAQAAPKDLGPTKGTKKLSEPEILDEAQWKWLETELRQNSAQLTLIGNSTQIIPEEHPFAKWANHPQARERFLKLLAKTNSKGVVLLSGERRLAEISQLTVKGFKQPLYEVTSSGLTLPTKCRPLTETNKHRVGSLVAKRNFGLIQIDWDKRQATLQVVGDRNETLLSQSISF